jgi:ligand-binding SRPBCC domain-containing protein
LPKIYRLQREQVVPAGLEAVWAFFATPANLNVMTPPDMQFEIVFGGEAPMHPGQLIEYHLTFIPGVKSTWLTEITHLEEKCFFIDEQRIGPYRLWHHEHRFAEEGGKTRVIDTVSYALPFGLLGELIHALWVRHRLEEIFDYRRKMLQEMFA